MWRGEMNDGVSRGGPERDGYVYETVSPGNPDLATDLRKQFDVAKPFDIDLATTMVPVVTVDLTDADSTQPDEHLFIGGTSRVAGAGFFAVSRIYNGGAGTVLVERVRISNASSVHMLLAIAQGINASVAGVLAWRNTIPASIGLQVLDEQSAGGLTNPTIQVHAATQADFSEVQLDVVLRTGESISLYSALAASNLRCAWFGTEFEA